MFGGFALERVLGQGAMGRVYLAQSSSGQRVALKVLLESPEDEEASERFVREGLAMAAVPRHPNVLGVVTAGQDCGLLFLALELATGGDLEQELVAAGRLEPAAALELAEALADALDHVHQAGIVHRDLKPANAIRREDGTLALADFGLAKVNSLERLTQTGEMLGTPLYMAPEQVMGEKDLDGRADLWALGVILYRALSGQLPFQGATSTQTMQLILDEDPAPLSAHRPDLGAGYQELITRALAKEREDRFQSGAEFRDAIRGCREREGRQSDALLERKLKRVLLALSAVALLLVLATAGVLVLARKRQRADFTKRLAAAQSQGKALAGDLLARSAPPAAAALEEYEASLAELSAHAGAEETPEEAARLEALRRAALRGRWREALAREAWDEAEGLTEAAGASERERVLMRQVALLARGARPGREVLEELAGAEANPASRGARILLAGLVAEADPARAMALLRDLEGDPLAAPERSWAETLAAIEPPLALEPIVRCGPKLSASQRVLARGRIAKLLFPLTTAVEDLDAVLDLPPEKRTIWERDRVTELLEALGALRLAPATPSPPREGALLRALMTRIGQSILARDQIKDVPGWHRLLKALAASGLRADQRSRAPVLMPFVLDNKDDLPLEVLIDYGMMLFKLDVPVDVADLHPQTGGLFRAADLSPGTETPLAEFVTLRLKLLKGDGPGRATLLRLLEMLRETPEVVGPYCRADALAFVAANISLPLEEREGYVKEALALDPKSPWVRVSRALCLAERGQEEEARREEVAALEVHLDEQTLQEDADSFFARRSGLIYAALGDQKTANERLRGIKFPTLGKRVQREAEVLFDRYGRALRKKREKR